MKKVKLFLVAVDGNDPMTWKPFDGKQLQYLSGRFREEARNMRCSITFEIEITSIHISDLPKEILPRVIGCIVDVQSFEHDGHVSDNFRDFSYKIRKSTEDRRPIPLYVISNINHKHPKGLKNIEILKGQLSLSGYRGSDIQVYPLTEDDDIGNALSIIATNIATNEQIRDSLGLD